MPTSWPYSAYTTPYIYTPKADARYQPSKGKKVKNKRRKKGK